MQRKAVKVTWWRVSSASNFNWNKTRANFSFRTYIIPVAPWRFSLLIVGCDIGGLANYRALRKHLGDIAKRNGNAKKNLGWFAEMIRDLFMSIICTVSFSKTKLCQFFFVFSFLFSSVKFPPSHVGLLQISCSISWSSHLDSSDPFFIKTEINSPHQRPCSAVLFIFYTQYSTSK